MATLSRQSITESGIAPTYSSAAGGGDQFRTTGNEFIHVKNGGGSSITVTVTAQNTSASNNEYGLLTKSDVSVSIGAGADKFIGPFPVVAFSNAGFAEVSYSAVTSVTLAVLTL